jgi:hypothetical protein
MSEIDPIAEGRAAAEAYNGEAGEGFKNDGRKNAYVCEDCGSSIITVDRGPGFTPFLISCGNCKGMAQSKMYRVVDWLEPTHEWHRPESVDGLNAASIEHVRKGGLILRPIPGSAGGWVRPVKPDADLVQRRQVLEQLMRDAAAPCASIELTAQRERKGSK